MRLLTLLLARILAWTFGVGGLAVGVGCAGDPPPPLPAQTLVRAADPTALHLGGTGALTPLVTALGEAWAQGGGSPPVVIEDSIGSGGGIRAAAAGAVDLGLVSRPLGEDERQLGLVVIVMGRDAVAVVAHPGVPIDGLSKNDLLAFYRGEKRRYDDGHAAVPLLRDRSESANGALERVVPGLSAAREQAYRDRRLRVLYSDRAMAEAIRSTRGAFGVLPLASVLTAHLAMAAFKVLAIDGVQPSAESLANGSWGGTRDLYLVARPDRLGRAEGFLRFARSPQGRALSRSLGYLPPPEAAP